MSRKPIKTAAQVRAEFLEAGISVAGWARANGFTRETVVDLLRGQSKGLRGEAHRAAVALGLKAGRVVGMHQFKPAPPPARGSTQRRARKAA